MNRKLLLSLSLLVMSCGPAWSQIVPQNSAQAVANHAVKEDTTKANGSVQATTEKPLVGIDKSAPDENQVIPVSSGKQNAVDDSDVTPPDIEVPLTFDSEMYGNTVALQPSMPPSKVVSAAPMVTSNTTSVPAALTSGNTVRVQGLTNLEALTNIMANAFIVLGIAWAGPSLVSAFMRAGAGEQSGLKVILHVVMSLAGIMAIPGVVNWLVASGREAGVFLGF